MEPVNQVMLYGVPHGGDPWGRRLPEQGSCRSYDHQIIGLGQADEPLSSFEDFFNAVCEDLYARGWVDGAAHPVLENGEPPTDDGTVTRSSTSTEVGFREAVYAISLYVEVEREIGHTLQQKLTLADIQREVRRLKRAGKKPGKVGSWADEGSWQQPCDDYCGVPIDWPASRGIA